MISITKYNDNGVIISSGITQPEALHLHKDNTYIGIVVDHHNKYFLNGVLCHYTEEELEQKKLSGKDWVWKMPERKLVHIKTIETIKAEAIKNIKNKRKQLEMGSFFYKNISFQINEIRINAAAEEAKILKKSFIKTWILTDNTLMYLDDIQMLKIKQTQDKHIFNLFDTCLNLINKINLATTIEEINTVSWPEN